MHINSAVYRLALINTYIHHKCYSITVNKSHIWLQYLVCRVQMSRICIHSHNSVPLLCYSNVLSVWMNECVSGVHCTCSGWLALDSGITIQMMLRLLRAALVVKEQGSTAAWPRATWILLWDTVTSSARTHTAGGRRRSSASSYAIDKHIYSTMVWTSKTREQREK